MHLTEPDVIAEIRRHFENRGATMYAGEPVTQTEHALQCATAAEKSGASAALITASLLHDIGHLLHAFGEDCADEGIDDQHERVGAAWLEQFFPPDVCEPVKLHVPAKRYRCAVDADYHAELSAASVQSLQLQGGPMSAEEIAEFRRHEWFHAALQLRSWDEAAKIPGFETPSLEHFLQYVAGFQS